MDNPVSPLCVAIGSEATFVARAVDVDIKHLAMVLERVARQKGISPAEFEKEILRYNSMRTKIAPEELANAVFFLASNKAPHITGVMFEVSGGHEWEE